MLPSIPATRPELKWLFVANFKDNTSIEQTQEDRSYTREDGTGSAFTDVLAHESDLLNFKLLDMESDDSVAVDLKTGLFYVNGIEAQLHNQYFEPEKYELELVYFRETKVEMIMGADAEQKSVSHSINKYFIGWKTLVHGKIKQVTLAVG